MLEILKLAQNHLSGEVTRGRLVNKKYFKQLMKQVEQAKGRELPFHHFHVMDIDWASKGTISNSDLHINICPPRTGEWIGRQ